MTDTTFTAWLLADDDWRTTRLVAVGLASLVSWRALWLYAQSPSPAPAAHAAATPHLPRRWLRSRHERLLDDIALVRANNELRRGHVDGVKAEAELAQARAELQQLIAALAPANTPPAPPAALTLTEIETCLTLCGIEPEQRATLQALLIAAVDEKTHA